ncbi:hypothetical protein [Photobacterium angustum]|uniref:hypothetical protein n=1 Tax=Photobacterium angustum TaxID=661 RepID=UPI0005EB7C39|nr:hypothetical protein [Photobacterium angustum]PSW96717.1 hypothetical protein C0W79_00170 [Photobacterium angustum]
MFEYHVTGLGRDGTYNIVVHSQVKLADGSYSYDVWSAIFKLSDSMANYCSIGDESIASEDIYHYSVVPCTDPNLVTALVFHESYLNDNSLNIGDKGYSFSKNKITVDSSTGKYVVSLYLKELTINDFGELSYFVTSTGIEFN